MKSTMESTCNSVYFMHSVKKTQLTDGHTSEGEATLKMTIKIYKYRQTQQIYYTLPLPGYMFRLLRVIIRPSNELTQDYLIPSALWER